MVRKSSKAPQRKDTKKAPKKATPVEALTDNPVLSQIDRIAKLGTDYGAKFNQSTAKGLYAYFGAMTTQELMLKLKSPSITAIERSVIVHISKVRTEGKDSLPAIQYFHERAFGKVETKTEITGKDGGSIKIENETSEIDNVIAQMTDEELEALDDSLEKLDSILGSVNVSQEE